MNACFFDMDGTLVDSRADLAATVNHTRRDMGLRELPEAEVLNHVGQGARYLLEHAIPECASDVESARENFMGHYAEHCCERVSLYPGVRRTLEELSDRGWLLGINTNKPSEPNRLIVEHLGLRRFFGSAIIAGGDCAELKPSALPLRECASRMHGHRLSSHDWMVGDAWTDMQCAANAGIKCAFCTFGFGKLNDSRYTIRINRMDELLRYLKAEE